MSVPFCHLCDSIAEDKARYGATGLDEGEYCAACYQPFCKQHGSVVRWRWKATREVASTRVCRACKTAYRYRYVETDQREWIS